MVILFDFDGTICDSLDLYLKVCNQYLTKRNRPAISRNELRAQGIVKIAEKEKIPRWQLFWLVLIGRVYVIRHIHELSPFIDIENELSKLSKKHVLGIVTSNSKRNVSAFLKNNNLSKYFSFIENKVSYFGKAQKLSEVLQKRHIPNNQCMYVGDETRDIKAAKQNMIYSVAVSWGFENKQLLAKSQPDLMITKQSLLYKKISNLLSKNK